MQELLQTHPGLIHRTNRKGHTPLSNAYLHEMDDLVRQFVRLGAGLNARGYKGKVEMVRLLRKAGSDL